MDVHVSLNLIRTVSIVIEDKVRIIRGVKVCRKYQLVKYRANKAIKFIGGKTLNGKMHNRTNG